MRNAHVNIHICIEANAWVLFMQSRHQLLSAQLTAHPGGPWAACPGPPAHSPFSHSSHRRHAGAPLWQSSSLRIQPLMAIIHVGYLPHIYIQSGFYSQNRNAKIIPQANFQLPHKTSPATSFQIVSHQALSLKMSSNRLFLRTLVLKIQSQTLQQQQHHMGTCQKCRFLLHCPSPSTHPFQRNEAKTLNPEGLLKRLLAILQVIQSLELAVPTSVKDVPPRDSKHLTLGLCLKEIPTRCSRRPILSIH